MKNSKLKFSQYMQNISRSKTFGKFVLIVQTFQPFCYTDTSQQLTASPETHRQCVVLVRPANIELRLLSLTLPHSVLSSRTRNSSHGVRRRVKASMVEETLPQCLNPSRNFGYKKLVHDLLYNNFGMISR